MAKRLLCACTLILCAMCLWIQWVFFLLLSHQAANRPQALAVQRVSRSLVPRPVARGDGAPAQRSLPRNLPSASPQIHSRYLQHSNTNVTFWLLQIILLWLHYETLAQHLSSVLNVASSYPSCVFGPQSLIPDIRPCIGQEAVVDLHPEEAVLSGAEDDERERSDQDLQIRRTVTQVGLQLLLFFSEWQFSRNCL